MTSQVNFQIKRATRRNTKLKMALIGIAGSGKTYSALNIAKGLGDNVLVIDTEHGSASKYAEFNFDTIELENFNPLHYVRCIEIAQEQNYDVIILDSLSHAWTGKGGALEMVDQAGKRSQSGNSFGAWRNVTPLHNQLIDAIVGAKIHVIATMRAKTEHVQEKDERTGKTVVRKVGLAPVQRDQMEYEFDIVGDITQEHELIVTKSRCSLIADQIIPQPGRQLAKVLLDWINDDMATPPPIDPTLPSPEESQLEAATAAYEDLLEQGVKLGIKRRELPPDADLETVEKYFRSLSDAIARRKNPHLETPPAGTTTTAPPTVPPVPRTTPEPQSTLVPEEEPCALDKHAVKPDAIIYTIPAGTPTSECRGCGQKIAFVRTKAGGSMPVNLDGTAHWGNCTQASQFRRDKPASNTPADNAPASNSGRAKHLNQLFAVCAEHGIDTEDGPRMRAIINHHFKGTRFPAIKSRGDATPEMVHKFVDDLKAGLVDLRVQADVRRPVAA
jgi:hypothetical protein